VPLFFHSNKMNAPQEFLDKFEEEFGHDYRIRWSDARKEWHVEQRMGHGFAAGTVDLTPRNAEDYRLNYDDRLRARDGYILTFVVSPGTRTQCDECHTWLKVPEHRFEAIECPYCAMRGRKRLYAVAYFPLGESLLDHLRKIDVFSGGNERVRKAVAERNRFIEAEADTQFRRDLNAGLKERFNRLVGIPQWGYAGEQKMWDRSVPFTKD
jgi:hypothetical protein